MNSTRMTRITVALALSVLPLAAPSARAFGVSGVGGSGGYLSPEARDATATVGMHAELEQRGTRVHLMPGFMYWGSDRRSDFNPNLDVVYHVLPDRRVTPYMGAGLGVHMRGGPLPSDDSNDLGMNLMGGVRIPARSAKFFVEGRHTMSDLSQTALVAGATVPIH